VYHRGTVANAGGVPDTDAKGKVTALIDHLLPDEAGDAWVGFQIGYMDHAGCHQLDVCGRHSRVSYWLHGPFPLSSIEPCFDNFKNTVVKSANP
jgi:hypothetical protein